jgi:hypothetical protein
MTNGERDPQDCILYGCDYGDGDSPEGLLPNCVVCGQPKPAPVALPARSWLGGVVEHIRALNAAAQKESIIRKAQKNGRK